MNGKIHGLIDGRINAKIDQLGSLLNQYRPYSEFQTLVNSKVTPKLTGNNSTFGGACDWVTALGSLQPDVATYPGYMYLNCTSGNQAVKIENKVETGATKTYLFKIRIKIQSGSGTTFEIGAFPASDTDASKLYSTKIIPTAEFKWFYALFSNYPNTTFYLGVLTANNNGTKFLIDEIKIDEVVLSDLYDLDITNQAISYTNGLFSTISKSANELLELNVFGDSILANSMGTIPVVNDEGNTMRPVRLVSNNVVRHLYDDRKYNVPTFRRLDHAQWVKTGSDFVAQYFTDSAENEFIYKSVTANSYCEIVVPDGVENFAVIFRTGYSASPGYDSAITATINGGDISSYGSAQFSTDTANLYSNNNITIQKYIGLPSGVNTIRFTKSNDAKIFEVWGGFYWNGNTVILKNYAQGGSSTVLSAAICKSHILNFGLTNILFEFNNINNCGQSITAISQVTEFLRLFRLNNYQQENMVFVTTHPFGTDPSDGTPNYYTTYNSPLTFKQRSTLDICISVYFGLRYIDLFRLFEKDIINRGGTLTGGEAGSYYTNDGQHLDEDGVTAFSNFLLPKLPEIPD